MDVGRYNVEKEVEESLVQYAWIVHQIQSNIHRLENFVLLDTMEHFEKDEAFSIEPYLNHINTIGNLRDYKQMFIDMFQEAFYENENYADDIDDKLNKQSLAYFYEAVVCDNIVNVKCDLFLWNGVPESISFRIMDMKAV